MVSNSVTSFDKTHHKIVIYNKYIFPMKDTRTFTLIKNIPFGEKKRATGLTKGVPKWTWKQHVSEYPIRNSIEFQFWKESSQKISYCHLFIRSWKQTSKFVNEFYMYMSGEPKKPNISDIGVVTAWKLSVKIGYIFWDTWYISIIYMM